MKNYYLEESIENMEEQNGGTREENLERIKEYFKSNFSEEELLELLIRGQVHAMDDERTNGYYTV